MWQVCVYRLQGAVAVSESEFWRTWWELNPQPSRSERDALSQRELQALA